MDSPPSPQQIDIANVLNKRLRTPLPRFLTNFVAKLIHQREINSILQKYSHLEGVDFMEALVGEFEIDITLQGGEHLPESPRALFIANHPLGGLDGICLSQLIGRHYQSDVRYIVNDLLLQLRPLAKIFVPVNKYGAQARSSLQLMQEALSSDMPVLTFPAGLCSRIIDGRVQDPEWRISFLKQARQYERPIVPLHFQGRNSMLFYRIEQVRKALGVKFNIGTALLPHEMFSARGKHFCVKVGAPISYEQLIHLTPGELKRCMDKIRSELYAL